MGDSVVDARGTYKLADDNTFRTVNDKCASLCHQRKISHENFMFIDLISLFVVEPYPYFQGCRISRIALFALVDRVFHIIFAECEIHKFQTQMAAEI